MAHHGVVMRKTLRLCPSSLQVAGVDLQRFSAVSSEFDYCLHLPDGWLVLARPTIRLRRSGYCRHWFCGAPLWYYSCGIQHFHIDNFSARRYSSKSRATC